MWLLSTYTPYARESVFPKSLTELYKPATLRQHHYIPLTHKAHTFPIAPTSAVHPSSVSFRKITQRAYHTTKPAHRTILTGAVVTAFFQIARSVITALPILWRWQWFTAYPRAMWSLASIPVIGAATIAALALEQHPLTLRNRLMFIDEPTELNMAEQSYADLLKRYQLQLLPEHHPYYRDIQRVADSLLSIVGPVRDWKLHVIDDDAVINAFVTPTGKIFVFTGLLQNSVAHDSVAAILAHELAHVLSRHGAEKLGFQYVARLFSDFVHSLLYTLTLNLPIIADLGGRTVDATKHLLSTKPYSRMCESEADSIGLYLMSMAGWNPHAAVEFWDEMSLRASSTENAQSATTCEFLSDHPAHTTRADDLRGHLPTALKIYHSRQQAVKQFSEEIAYENTAPLESLNRALHNVLVMHAEKDPWDLDYMEKVDARVAI
ncbi:hypothetical protein HDU85_004177 [Gaertneriomyces sp. JEL0708]|nr:hypothetical protein HDU85_004177 [Gaertneriomyces sp. JEL0708]